MVVLNSGLLKMIIEIVLQIIPKIDDVVHRTPCRIKLMSSSSSKK